MKLKIGLGLLLATTVPIDITYAQTIYPCPTVGGATIIPPSTPARLEIVTDSNTLCTLIRHNITAGGTQRAPIARSYSARSTWEISAGLFSNSATSGVTLDCTSGETYCDVTLPPLGSGEEYILESFTRPTVPIESSYTIEELSASRFLEQATFGPTRESINDLAGSNLDYEGWIVDQINTKHVTMREYYRKRTNPKYEFPYVLGAVGSGPCDLYSRWRRYAISSKDMIDDRNVDVEKYLTITQVEGVTGYVWLVDGQFRTVTSILPVDSNMNELSLDVKYRIENRKVRASFGDCVGCPVYVTPPGESMITIENPVVDITGIVPENISLISLPSFKSNELPSIEDSTDYPMFSQWIKSDENALLNTTSLQCDDVSNVRVPIPFDGDGAPGETMPGYFPSVFGQTDDGVVFLYDRHLTFYENTIENPLIDGGGSIVMATQDTPKANRGHTSEPVKCFNVKRNFYNEDHCKLSYETSACAAHTKPKKVIVLDDANLEGIRARSGKDLYPVTGLVLSDVYDTSTGLNSPCAFTNMDQWSRWMKDETDTVCDNIENLGNVTFKIYQEFVNTRDYWDFNDNIVDALRDHRTCDAADEGKTYLGKVKASDGSCWNHVHQSEMNVVDLTGANETSYTISGNVAIITSMDAFNTDIASLPVIGKYGDHVEIDNSLPSPLNDKDIQNEFKTYEYNPQGKPVLMCGSPEEIASDPFYGDQGFDVVTPDNTGLRSKSTWELAGQKHTIWTEMALNGNDQLRQKTAWSLSQIVSVGMPSNVNSANDFEDTEGRLAFYDMLGKNALGSYRDLMREYSFNAIMASWLSYEDNRSLQHNIEKSGFISYPDENYAREIMQLFSIGLHKLNMDGSIIYQENGNPEDSYSIDDIVSYSRAWTGFVERPERGGAATAKEGNGDTTLDPLYIDIAKRDEFPKNNLLGGFIGDKVALCTDLPSKHFIKKDATYRLLGSSGRPEMHKDPELWTTRADFYKLDLETPSPLYVKLCQADSNGDCTFPAKVVLDANLVYDDVAKLGKEYAVDTVRTVRMKVGSIYIWYEYIRQPCVEHSYYRDAKRLIQGETRGSSSSPEEKRASMCGNPLSEIATPMCSAAGWETTKRDGLIYCNYQGERMSYDSASALCQSNGLEQSYPWEVKTWKAGKCQHGIAQEEFRSWANRSCGLKVKVEFDTSQVALVHSPGADRSGKTTVENKVDIDTLNFFAVPWEGGLVPTSSQCLENDACVIHEEKYCICDTDTTTSQVYSMSSQVTSIDQLMSELHTGAADPTSFDGIYTDLGSCDIAGVTVYSKTGGSCDNLLEDTIFAFEVNNKQFYLKNSKSVVTIPGSNFTFRNPVQFISLADPEVRDAYYETEEVLDSLFFDPSHAPFMSIRMIQRFGISNPSPGFIERVATAYKMGSYGQVGSNKYGDLSAMVAAILLDDESRALVLDTDQSHGALKEPLIKVTSLFRSMGLQYNMPNRVPTLMAMEPAIGQGSFENPSVFSFFLPEFSPPGVVGSAGLVSPESMVLSGDNILTLLDASYSTTKFGLIDVGDCKWTSSSFIDWRHYYPFPCPDTEGDTSKSPAVMSYASLSTSSVDEIIDDLDLLLTAGRLQGSANRAIIRSIVEPMMSDSVDKATRAAQQLVVSTPEYHSTSLPRKVDNPRVITGYTEKPKAPYKAVVVLMLRGGCDSWNMLVPKGNCATADAYEEYVQARVHAIPKNNLLNISTTDQDCTEFGVNENLPIIADLYNQDQAVFFANTGTVTKPITNKDQWKQEMGFRPFAHNTMQEMFYTGDPKREDIGTGVMGRMLDTLNNQGLQTSANNVNSGMTMLSGDPTYSNPVFTVSTKDPAVLNQKPTIDNLMEDVKVLNGVGLQDNSLLSEQWSSRVASALFEHELMHEIASMPEFDLNNYPESTVKLASSFKAVAGYMKSRSFRKVNRDVFVVSQNGFDMHKADELAESFQEVNEALDGFIQEIKSQGLWESTVIVQGSDFGRSMNTNSNSGTDHAWGGNYFMLGGSVKGGKIMGDFPTPLGPGSDYWLGRGRWIPTTPWDAVFNAVSQWMGVHDDADLDEILPNRESFSTCSLFSDKDLFTDGACACVDGATVCDDITYAPTLVPTGSPSFSPSKNPTSSPTSVPSDSPSSSPSFSPSENPTADLPDEGWLVANILAGGSDTESFGCINYSANPWKMFDGTTNKFKCDRDENGIGDPSNVNFTVPGFIISPNHGHLTIAKGIRFYPSISNKNDDPKTYLLEGRVNSTLPWTFIAEGEFPGVAQGLPRNNQASDTDDGVINSSYESGDTNRSFTFIEYHSHVESFLEYKLSFPEGRNHPNNRNQMQWAEIEIPGMMLPFEPSVSPTLAPSVSPTVSPSKSPTTSPSKGPSTSPTLSPSTSPTADLPDDGVLVNSIFTPDCTVEAFGCVRTPGNLGRAIDNNMDNYWCDRTGINNVTDPSFQIPGIIVSPSTAHGKTSIVKGLRLYQTQSCKGCDPIDYILEGRMDASSAWVEMYRGDLPWSPSLGVGWNDLLNTRNVKTTNYTENMISSTYESGDPNRHYIEVLYPSNAAEYYEYRLSFPETRTKLSNTMKFSLIELPGMLLPPEPSVSPTYAPSVSPTVSPSKAPTTSPTKTPTSAPSTSPTLGPSTSPTKAPSDSPSISPTMNPTVDLPDDGWLVANIFASGSQRQAETFGCINDSANPWRMFDGDTTKFWCDRTGVSDPSNENFTIPGMIISPNHGQLTIAKGIRFYPSHAGKGYDPKTYLLEGRVNSTLPWTFIAEGEFPGVAQGLPRNNKTGVINSSYERGDPTRSFTSIDYHTHGDAYLEYKLSFPVQRAYNLNSIQFGEIEIPGMMLPFEPSVSPTQAPSGTPTLSPSRSPVLPGSSKSIVCGSRNGACNADPVFEALPYEKHFVRCCADEDLDPTTSHWNQHRNCRNANHGVWGESNVPECYSEKNFTEAISICESVGARLCTEQELLDDCTRGTGCGYDSQHVWSSSQFNSTGTA